MRKERVFGMRKNCCDIDQLQQNEKVEFIAISELFDFPNHPFRVEADKDMMDSADSISRIGVVNPAVVRQKKDGGYEMIAGHRRKAASKIAGKTMLPCIIRDLSDEDAIIFLVDSNIRREEVLPSEKAFAYKMRLDAMKRKAGRPKKNNYVPLAHNFAGKTSRKYLSELTGESEDQIRRYIRLTELIAPILKMVDEREIALRPAVELSYLSQKSQEILVDIIENVACTPSHAQAIRLRELEEEKRFKYNSALKIMSELKANQKIHYKISADKLEKYFAPGTSARKIEETILKALELYKQNIS